ncbi:WbqC-like family protein [Nitrosotalea devaniterrae]|uniref:WbqC-like family protein n=1 Tax=Nitrosotalea devaniterrae TaxID=1078905 RepID=A0A128A0V1_9ARCH|nr:WbqC-like family protein [Candidatus Nitrosotalea devanaterra]
MTKVIIRQPGYLPYLGYFKKIQTCDVFVHLDDVLYSTGGGDNKNKIRTFQGTKILPVPISKPHDIKFNEIKIANDMDWREKHRNSIKENYKVAPFFDRYWNSIENILSKEWKKLIDLNLEFIKYFCSVLNLTTKTVRSSELDTKSTKSTKLLEICQKLGATCYISGEIGKNYLDVKLFENAGIEVIFEKFEHPIYRQIHGEFIPYLSIIDVLFNEGDNTKTILANSKNW